MVHPLLQHDAKRWWVRFARVHWPGIWALRGTIADFDSLPINLLILPKHCKQVQIWIRQVLCIFASISKYQ